MRWMVRYCGAVIVLVCLAAETPVWCKETAADFAKKGIALEAAQNLSAAVVAYDAAIDARTQDADVYFRRGRLTFLLDSTDVLNAIDFYSKGIVLLPDNADAYYQRGLLNAYAVYNAQARKDMEMAARLGHEGAQKWLDERKDEAERPLTVVALSQYLGIPSEPMVLFAYNDDRIRPSQYGLLDAVGRLLADKLSDMQLIISAHACDLGSSEYNFDLSRRRGDAVKSYLVTRYGIAPKRVVVKPFGETRPVVPNDIEENRAQNRRVEFTGVIR